MPCRGLSCQDMDLSLTCLLCNEVHWKVDIYLFISLYVQDLGRGVIFPTGGAENPL